MYRKLYKRCFIILSSITFVVSSMQGTVICVSEDGRVAVKFTNGVGCRNIDVIDVSEKTTDFLREAISSNKGNCHPCVDYPASIHLKGVSKKLNLVNPTMQAPNTITYATISSCDFSKNIFFAISDPTLDSLRTIIILI